MNRLIDTDVLIDHLRGRAVATNFLRDSRRSGHRLLCSVVTHAELYAGVRAEEEETMQSLLSLLETVQVTVDVARQAGLYRRSYGRSHGVEVPDALIAACARAVGAVLVTTNTRHFPMPDLELLRPY